MVITNYLDDYVPFSDVALTSVSEKVIRTVFHVLGFVLSTNPKKDHPFAETFTALGVEFLLRTPIASQPDSCSPSDPDYISPKRTCTAELGFV